MPGRVSAACAVASGAQEVVRVPLLEAGPEVLQGQLGLLTPWRLGLDQDLQVEEWVSAAVVVDLPPERPLLQLALDALGRVERVAVPGQVLGLLLILGSLQGLPQPVPPAPRRDGLEVDGDQLTGPRLRLAQGMGEARLGVQPDRDAPEGPLVAPRRLQLKA